MEFLGRFSEGFGFVPLRILSSSELKPSQFSTRITRCGVLSLKKNLERNRRKMAGWIGYPVNSITIAVLGASGEKISCIQPYRLLGGNNNLISVVTVLRMRR